MRKQRSYPFMQVDAFTDRPLGGNPCAIIFDADDLDSETMLAIARENNLSETSFVIHSDSADFGVRYFTPMEEIPLAGHPTIATAFALVDTGRVKLTGDQTTITLELRVGPLPVEIESREGRVTRVVMTQKRPEFRTVYMPANVMPAFGLDEEDALPGAPFQVVSTGTPQLMVPLRSMEALRRAYPDMERYGALRARGDFFSAHLFVLEGITPAGRTFSRHFVMPPDLVEDPFTGSATGGMAAYLWRYGLVDTPVFTVEQGHWMGRPGIGVAEVVGPADDIETVKVGGGAARVISGVLEI